MGSFQGALSLPPLPTWDAAHPIAVHLPLGVLVAVPMLLVFSLLSKKARLSMALATWSVLVLGTIGAVLAVSTGEAAERSTVIPQVAKAVLHEHEELAERTRNIFIALSTVSTFVLLLALIWRERVWGLVWWGAHVLLLAGVGFGLIQLANTGHLGGRLVHEFGVRAPISGSLDPGGRGYDGDVEDEPSPRP